MGCARQKGYTEQYRGVSANISLLAKIKVEAVVPSDVADSAVEAIVENPDAKRALYFQKLYPTFRQIKGTADEILQMNQQSMVEAQDPAVTISLLPR